MVVMQIISNLVRLGHHAVNWFGKLCSKMPPAQRHFWPVKTVEEEKKMLENSVPKFTQSATTWAFNIFKDQVANWERVNKDTSLESCSLNAITIDIKEEVQSLDTNILSKQQKNRSICV